MITPDNYEIVTNARRLYIACYQAWNNAGRDHESPEADAMNVAYELLLSAQRKYALAA